MNQRRFWHELVGNSSQSSQQAVKAIEPPKQAGMKAKVEWTQGQQPGCGEHPRETRDAGMLPLIPVQGRKKMEIPCSRHPFSSELPTGKAAKPWEAAGADKGCDLKV